MGSDLLVLSPYLPRLKFHWVLWSLPYRFGKRWELSQDLGWLLDLCLLDRCHSKPSCVPFRLCSSFSSLSIFRFLLSSSTLILTPAVGDFPPHTSVLLASWLRKGPAETMSAWIFDLIPLVWVRGARDPWLVRMRSPLPSSSWFP